jgi:hypothetical protein
VRRFVSRVGSTPTSFRQYKQLIPLDNFAVASRGLYSRLC